MKGIKFGLEKFFSYQKDYYHYATLLAVVSKHRYKIKANELLSSQIGSAIIFDNITRTRVATFVCLNLMEYKQQD
jgi:hypothetical protein